MTRHRSTRDQQYFKLSGDAALTPISRATDPISSHLAAAEITDSGVRGAHMRMILDAISHHDGETVHEMSTRLPLDPHQINRRLSDLAHLGLIRKGPVRQCRVSGRVLLTWYFVVKTVPTDGQDQAGGSIF